MQVDTGHGETLGTLGKRIRAVRRSRGIKLITCAREIGVSRTSLHAWEADAVKSPDGAGLLAFVKLTDISLDWLVDQKGAAPDLAPRGKKNARRGAVNGPTAAAPDHPGVQFDDIPEVAPSLTRHAGAIDKTPRAFWRLPREVAEMGFNATPGALVVKRVVTREGGEFGVARGDYVLIDTGRTRIDEPGLYLIADPGGRSARRALVERVDGVLRVILLADDVDRENSEFEAADSAVVLGRIMGIFKPV